MATILTVDDRPENRSFLTTLLAYGGHRLLEAADGAEALEVARAGRPDLIIADILMPTMDGFELVRQLRADPATAAIPVIFYTAAYQGEESHALAEAGGVVRHLAKPADPEVILRAVDEALNSAPSDAPAPPAEYYDREHLRLLTDKLAGQVAELEREVTERKRVEEELRAAKEAADAASRARDRLLRMVSHELRTPLTPVLLAVTALLDRPAASGPEVRSTLEMIRDNVELETRLIDDLLSFSSVARGKLRLDLVCTDVHEVVRRAKETCRAEAQAVGLDLVLKLGAAEHHARGDSTRLRQVFWNLIRNAIKFTPPGGGVTIRTRNEGDAPGKHLIVEVSDTGIGIEPQALSRIFQPFEQGEPTPNQRRYGGLGLGLAISRGFAEAHGGRLSAASAGAGRGATFTLQLATVPPPGPAVSVPRSSPDEVPRAPGMRILLVDDNRPTLECLAVFLGRCRHVVRAATDLSSALRLAAAEEFDLVISDIELPDGSGLDLMRWIRAARPIAGIAVSGFGAEEDLRMSREAGFAEHLTKPILARDLEDAIARTHQATRATRSSNGSSGDTMPNS